MDQRDNPPKLLDDRVDRLGEALARLYFEARRDYTIDLSHRAVRLLQYVAHNAEPPRVDEVARYLRCATSTASELIKRLQKKDLLVRRRSTRDERVVEIELTQAGRIALTEHTSLDPEALRAGLAGLQDQDQKSFSRLLETLVDAAGGWKTLNNQDGQ